MSRGKIIGYIVFSTEGVFCEFNDNCVPEIKHPTLWFGGEATLFPTRRQARQAVERTKRYKKLYFTKEGQNPENYWPWLERIKISAVRTSL